ncbi:hypothetical protein ACWDRO_26580, partial [Streptomyces sp. NPDC003668]
FTAPAPPEINPTTTTLFPPPPLFRSAPGRRPPAPAGRPGGAPPGGRRTALAVGVGLASLGLLATVLTAMDRPGDDGVPHPSVTLGVPAGHR